MPIFQAIMRNKILRATTRRSHACRFIINANIGIPTFDQFIRMSRFRQSLRRILRYIDLKYRIAYIFIVNINKCTRRNTF